MSEKIFCDRCSKAVDSSSDEMFITSFEYGGNYRHFHLRCVRWMIEQELDKVAQEHEDET